MRLRSFAGALLIGAWASTCPPAAAYDGSGNPAIPTQGGVIDSRYTWDGDLGEPGVWSLGALGERVHLPVSFVYNPGSGEDREEALVSGLMGVHLRGSFNLSGRVGVGVAAPLWLTSQEFNLADGTRYTGGALGDLRLYGRLGLIQPEGESGFALELVPDLQVGTGSGDLLGGGYGGGFRFAAGYSTGWLRLAANLGVGGATEQRYHNVDQRVHLRGAALFGLQPSETLGFAAEVWALPSLSDAFEQESSPAEVSLSVSGRIAKRLGLTGGVGRGITSGAGASKLRLNFGLTWIGEPIETSLNAAIAARLEAAARTSEPVTSGPPGPYDLLITATDEDGRPVDAHVHVGKADMDVGPQDWDLGADGQTRLPLSAGNWEVTLSKDGRERQSRRFDLQAGRFRPLDFHAVLLARRGDGALSVKVSDNEARGVEGALIAVDGVLRGTTSDGGELTIVGLARGGHTVEASQTDFAAPIAVTAVAQAPGAWTPPEVAVLQRAPGSVKVVARSNHGLVLDAVVRFIPDDPEELDPGPQPIGERGERTVQLASGGWTAVVSAPAFGVQERQIVIHAGQTTLVNVDVVFAEALGDAALHVRVVDTDGRPVEGAELWLDGESVGSTSNLGTLTMSGLKEGSATLAVRGHGLRGTAERTVDLVGGTHDVLMSVEYLPGTVHVLARGPDGPVSDAMVRFAGPVDLPPSALGPDGRGIYELKAGEWQVILSSAEFGLQTRDVRVRPEQTSMIFIDARLLASEKGDATMSLVIVDAEGRPVEGAIIRLDGADIGTTSTGGDLTLGTLQAGIRSVAVTGDLFLDYASDAIELKAGPNRVVISLTYRPSVIRLRARDAGAAPVDGVVRLYGADAVEPARLGPTGERLFALSPGPWAVALSSEILGISEMDFTVVGAREPALVDLLVSAPTGVTTSLRLGAVDPDGQPIATATATLPTGSQPLGPSGALLLDELQPGPFRLHVAAPGYKEASDTAFALATGAQERTFHLDWLPRTMRVKVLSPAGKPVDAEVVFQRAAGTPGGRPLVPQHTGGDGVLEQVLLPGRVKVTAVAAGFGAQQKDVSLPAGDGPFELTLKLTGAKVDVTAAQVTIKDQVHFRTDSAAISRDSFKILDEVASTLIVHPEILQVEVQGHTDDVGGAQRNLELSQRRANAVRLYLTEKGIESGRLVPKGYGSTVPIGSNATDAGRSQNRRVQFVIAK
ncbi:MAG: hypothetical protein EXR69_06515 [Myxococcales bacterium]|nr:hypothetical protein [Myxococcales bacterium]